MDNKKEIIAIVNIIQLILTCKTKASIETRLIIIIGILFPFKPISY